MRLIVREIGDETLVYDCARDAATCLNNFAAKVWRQCDGEKSVAEIADELGEDERAVWLALHQLTEAELLTEAIAFPPDVATAKSRREIAGRLGLGAAALVASIVVPISGPKPPAVLSARRALRATKCFTLLLGRMHTGQRGIRHVYVACSDVRPTLGLSLFPGRELATECSPLSSTPGKLAARCLL